GRAAASGKHATDAPACTPDEAESSADSISSLPRMLCPVCDTFVPLRDKSTDNRCPRCGRVLSAPAPSTEPPTPPNAIFVAPAGTVPPPRQLAEGELDEAIAGRPIPLRARKSPRGDGEEEERQLLARLRKKGTPSTR